jgi:arabinofuranan 3-O-arabinosyltransferase
MRTRRTALRTVVLASIAALLLAVALSARISRSMPDFEVYWTAAARAWHAEPLYRGDLDGHYQFKYLPAFAVLTAPVSRVPLRAAKPLWFATSVLLLIALVSSSFALLPERRKPDWFLIVFTLVVMLKFYAHELVLGQVNVLFALIVVGAAACFRAGREAAAGGLIALAIVVKPYAVIFLPWLVARRGGKAAIAAGIAVAALFALPALVYDVSGNIDLHRGWWTTVTETTAPNLTNADNVSIAAMWAKWLGPGPLASVLTVATAAGLVVAAVFVFLRRRQVSFPEGLEVGLLLTCIPLLSPQGWDYVFLVSTPAIVFLLNYEDRLPTPVRAATLAALAIVGLSLFDLMGRAAYGRFMALSIVTVCYFVVVAGLCTLRARRLA